ncbi:MAG: ATP-binding cassette domain-containing protein [Proteobacteria bacterium]|nr:ATP-binding cassette domain-containing protein [Pseudomonadota bacterium]
MDLIRIEQVTKNFGEINALRSVSLNVPSGCILGLIGPNGAGKTTLLNTINGVYKPDGGHIYFEDRDLSDLEVHEIAQLGISRTFQIVRTFRRLSALENMFAASIYSKHESRLDLERAEDLLKFVGLLEKRDQYAYELSGGQQKLLEFARALMPDPKTILMDEPFAGVHPEIKGQLRDNIREMNKREKKTFIVVSHDMESIEDLCHRLVVLNIGAKLAEGETKEVLSSKDVIDAYLGE